MVRTNASLRRRAVNGDLLSERENAAELRAFTARQIVLREHRRIAAAVADYAVQVGRRQNLLTTVGRTLSGISAGLGYVALGLLLYVGELPPALAGTAVLAMRTAAQAIVGGIYSINQMFEVGMHVDLYRTCLADLAARRRPPRRPRPRPGPADDRPGRRLVPLPRPGPGCRARRVADAAPRAR